MRQGGNWLAGQGMVRRKDRVLCRRPPRKREYRCLLALVPFLYSRFQNQPLLVLDGQATTVCAQIGQVAHLIVREFSHF